MKSFNQSDASIAMLAYAKQSAENACTLIDTISDKLMDAIEDVRSPHVESWNYIAIVLDKVNEYALTLVDYLESDNARYGRAAHMCNILRDAQTSAAKLYDPENKTDKPLEDLLTPIDNQYCIPADMTFRACLPSYDANDENSDEHIEYAMYVTRGIITDAIIHLSKYMIAFDRQLTAQTPALRQLTNIQHLLATLLVDATSLEVNPQFMPETMLKKIMIIQNNLVSLNNVASYSQLATGQYVFHFFDPNEASLTCQSCAASHNEVLVDGEFGDVKIMTVLQFIQTREEHREPLCPSCGRPSFDLRMTID